MLASKVARRSYSSVSPDFLASVLQRVKEVPFKIEENAGNRGPRAPRGNRRARKERSEHSDGRSGEQKFARDNSKGNSRFRDRRTPRDSNGEGRSATPAGANKRQTPKLAGTKDYNDISGSVENLTSKTNRRTGEKKTRKSVPGLKIANKTLSDTLIQSVKFSSVYTPENPTLLSLLKYRPSLAPTFTSRTVKYALSTLKESNFPLHRPLNEGLKLGGADVNRRLTISPDSFGEAVPFSGLKLQLEPLTKNFKVSPDLDELAQSVKGQYHILKPYTKKDFANLAKSDEKRESLKRNGDIVRISLEQSNLNHGERELLHKVCSGLAPVSELKA